MPRNLLQKIALGLALTPSEEATKDQEAIEFSKKMEPVDQMVQELRRYSAPPDAWTRILALPPRPVNKRSYTSFAVAGAAVLILSVPLGVLLTNELASSEAANQKVKAGATHYKLLVYSHNKKTKTLSSPVTLLLEPSPRQQKSSATEKSNGHTESMKGDKYYPIFDVKYPKSSTMNDAKSVSFPLLFAMSLDEAKVHAQLFLKSDKVEAFRHGPAIVDLEGKAVRLQKWTLTAGDGSKWMTSYGENEASVVRRIEGFETLAGKATLMYRVDTYPLTEAEFKKQLSQPIDR